MCGTHVSKAIGIAIPYMDIQCMYYDFIGVHTICRDLYIVIITHIHNIQLICDQACKYQPCEHKIPPSCIFTNIFSSEYIILFL